MTLVVNASAVAEILFGTAAGRRAAALIDGHELRGAATRAAQCSLLTLDARFTASAPDCALLP